MKFKVGDYVVVKKEHNDVWHGIGKIIEVTTSTFYKPYKPTIHIKMESGFMHGAKGGFNPEALRKFKDKKTALDFIMVEEL
jgi:hypothetical protein